MYFTGLHISKIQRRAREWTAFTGPLSPIEFTKALALVAECTHTRQLDFDTAHRTRLPTAAALLESLLTPPKRALSAGRTPSKCVYPHIVNRSTGRSLTPYSMASVEKAAIPETEITTIIPPPATNEAAHKALFTRELLCNIVTHLPFQGMLAATGVCREWRAILVSDPRIREGLFLKPAKVRLVLANERYVEETEELIPLDECHILGTALPFLHRIFDMISFRTGNEDFVNSMMVSLKTPNSMRQMPSSAFDMTNDFWNGMFITKPPCSKVDISIATCKDIGGLPSSGRKLHDIELQRVDGIKLGDFYDIFHSRLTGDYSKLFISLVVRDWVPEVRVPDVDSVRGRIKCEVHNGEVKRPVPPIACNDHYDSDSDHDAWAQDLSLLFDDSDDEDSDYY